MDTYKKIESIVAAKYGAVILSKKSIGDFMISGDHAVNVKSNNVNKQNYSPNMVSINAMHRWVFERGKNLSFIFVDYSYNDDLTILKQTPPIPIEHISWECLSIQSQGYGVIQMVKKLVIVDTQTKRDFYKGFLKAYAKYRAKEILKHRRFSKKFIPVRSISPCNLSLLVVQ